MHVYTGDSFMRIGASMDSIGVAAMEIDDIMDH
jgi:hypothetical protein